MTVWFRGRLFLLSMSSALSRLLSGGNVVRYADDFVITGRTRELLEREIGPLVEQFLRERGLELSLG
jgi:RNA-directed DNA polymerase